jgi:hypothetical protein
MMMLKNNYVFFFFLHVHARTHAHNDNLQCIWRESTYTCTHACFQAVLYRRRQRPPTVIRLSPFFFSMQRLYLSE